MREELVKKLMTEKRFYLLRKENIMEQIENKKIEVLDMEYNLETLKKDLARSNSVLDLLRENGF